MKALVFLYELRDMRRILLRQRDRCTQWSEPHDSHGRVFHVMAVSRQFDARCQQLLGWCSGNRKQDAKNHPMERTSLQNRTPTDALV